MAAFSLNQELSSLRSRFPERFPIGSGIRSHFPTGKPTSITALRRFAFRRGPVNLSTGGVSSSATVEADGSGRWIFTVDVSEGFELFNQKWTVAFVFTHSDTDVAHGATISGVLGGVLSGHDNDHQFKNSPSGGDPWIKENWPNVFDGGITVSLVDTDEDVLLTLGELALVAGFVTVALLAGGEKQQ
jgi:hypothetical protein